MAKYNRRPIEHPGVRVGKIHFEASNCAGCDRNEESEHMVPGYQLVDRQSGQQLAWICSRCAMSMVADILEHEVG